MLYCYFNPLRLIFSFALHFFFHSVSSHCAKALFRLRRHSCFSLGRQILSTGIWKWEAAVTFMLCMRIFQNQRCTVVQWQQRCTKWCETGVTSAKKNKNKTSGHQRLQKPFKAAVCTFLLPSPCMCLAVWDRASCRQHWAARATFPCHPPGVAWEKNQVLHLRKKTL